MVMVVTVTGRVHVEEIKARNSDIFTSIKPGSESGPLPNIGLPKFLKVAKVARTDLLATFKEAWGSV